MKKTVSGIMLTILLTSTLILALHIQSVKSEPRTWTVDDDGPADFHAIQQAIHVANPGDTIYVYNGTYNEHIYIYKSLTLIGESKYGTIIDGSGSGPVVDVYASHTNFTSFTVRNAGWTNWEQDNGIRLRRTQSSQVTDCIVSGCAYGIREMREIGIGSKNVINGNTVSDCTEVAIGSSQESSIGNIVVNNTIMNNTKFGIYFNKPYNIQILGNHVFGTESQYNHVGIHLQVGGLNNTIIGNRVEYSHYGIRLDYADSNVVEENALENCTDEAFVGVESSNNIIAGNSASGSTYGFALRDQSNDNLFTNNLATNNSIGIVVSSSNGNKIFHNNLTANNNYGIWFYYSPSNSISGNNITNNYAGIVLDNSSSNSIFHNSFVNNNMQAYSSGSMSVWDDGYPSGGNYWSDYGGVDIYSGPSQNETGIDGIGDTPYIIDENNQDNYPLMNSWFLPWGNWSHYHNYMEIVRVLLYLNETYPNIVDMFSIGKSWLDQDIYCIRLTNEDITHPKPKLFFVGYHHAREPISAELPLYFAVEAATNFGLNETITRMLNYSEIYIVPMLNVDAFEAFQQNEWQRKNVHPYDEDGDTLLDEDPPDDQDGDGYIEDLIQWTGSEWVFVRWEGIDDDSDSSFNEDWVGGVDLNRNYGYQWDATCDSGSPYTWAEDYRGPAPFSEPETQAIRDLTLTHDFKYAISLHSGTEVIGYPWGYTTDPTPDDAIFREIAANLSQLVGAPYGQNSGLYTASGMWDDWMYANRSTFALTCEIYTNNSAWQYEPGPDPDTLWEKGVFQFFNPNPHDIETVIQRWLPVFTYVTDRAITEAYDVTTTNITPLKTIVGQGFPIQINVTVTNQGYFTETFNVTVYANTPAIQTKVLTLTSGNSATITFTWNTIGFAKGNYTIKAYAWPVTGETDTTDNTKIDGTVFVTVAGDVTGEGLCDMQDISILVDKFLAEPGDPRWDPNCDVNNDKIIDMADISIAVDNFLKDP